LLLFSHFLSIGGKEAFELRHSNLLIVLAD